MTKPRPTTLKRIRVSERNETFYLDDGMLCQRLNDGTCSVILYADQDRSVRIPPKATEIAPYAFYHNASIQTLALHDRIRVIDLDGLEFGRTIPSVVYDILDADEGQRSHYVIHCPPGRSGYQAMHVMFGKGYFDIEDAYKAVDSAIAATRDVFARSFAIVERLRDPVYLDERTGEAFIGHLERAMPGVVVAFGQNGYVKGIDHLAEFGVLNEDNVEAAIELAADAGEVAVLGRLIEIRRARFGAAMFDFDV